MTPKQVVDVCDRYAHRLEDEFGTSPIRDISACTRDGKLGHLHWMCLEIPKMLYASDDQSVDSFGSRLEKAMRWLGFIQGAFMAMNVQTIEQMKEDNRT